MASTTSWPLKLVFKPLKWFLAAHVAIFLHLICPLSGESAVQLDQSNINDILHHNELVFVNFYADWCRFSNILAPIFEEAATKVKEEFPQSGRVVLARVDCDAETAISTQYHISKYPTLKLFRDGQMMKKEYRGQRSAESLSSYISEQLKDNVKVVFELNELNEVEKEGNTLIGFFEMADSTNFAIFQRMARSLRDECQFYAVFGDATKAIRDAKGGDKIVFRPKLVGDEAEFTGDIEHYETLQSWGADKCVPVVREITFENAEELTEEGLPFLILFHHPDDKDILDKFTARVMAELLDERSNVNFLVADGLKFSHPLHHLGKTEKDLPVLAIDSFRHMYIFPKMEELGTEGRLKKFVADLHSGKLHREFHHGPDPEQAEEGAAGDNGDNGIAVGNPEVVGSDIPREDPEPSPAEEQQNDDAPSVPPESVFKKLAPSSNRYTVIRDEL